MDIEEQRSRAREFILEGPGWHILKGIYRRIREYPNRWSSSELETLCRQWHQENQTLVYSSEEGQKSFHTISFGDVAMALRCALTASIHSPPIFEVMGILGQEAVSKRISDVIKFSHMAA